MSCFYKESTLPYDNLHPCILLVSSIGTSLTTSTSPKGDTLFTSCCVNTAESFQGEAWVWRGHGVSSCGLWSLDFQSVHPELARPWGRACAGQTHRSRVSIVNLLGILGWWERVTTSWKEGRAPAGPRKAAARQDAGSPFWVEQMLPEGSPRRGTRDQPRPGSWVSLGSSVGIHPPRAPRKAPSGQSRFLPPQGGGRSLAKVMVLLPGSSPFCGPGTRPWKLLCGISGNPRLFLRRAPAWGLPGREGGTRGLSCLSSPHTCPHAQAVTGTDCIPVFVTSHQELEGWWPFRTKRQEEGLAVELMPITLVSRTISCH